MASSAAVYGNTNEMFPAEEDNMLDRSILPMLIQNGQMKRNVFGGQKMSGMDAIALRFFNVYGPGQRSGENMQR